MKKIPVFKSASEERTFWSTADSTQYIDWRRARRAVLPNLRPSLRTISLRLPELMLEELKLLANKRDIPYQSLLKVFLADRIDNELRQPNGDTKHARAYTERESARRLAQLGGAERSLRATPRRRPKAAKRKRATK